MKDIDKSMLNELEEKASSEKLNTKEKYIINYLNKYRNPFSMLSIEQVAKDLGIGVNQAYDLFDQEDFPSVSIGKRKKVSLVAYIFWKLNNTSI